MANGMLPVNWFSFRTLRHEISYSKLTYSQLSRDNEVIVDGILPLNLFTCKSLSQSDTVHHRLHATYMIASSDNEPTVDGILPLN